MARENVGELVSQRGQRGGVALVRADEAQAPAALDPRALADRSPMPWRVMVSSGLAMVALGVVAAALTSTGFFGTVILSSLMTMGAGLAFLGLTKRRTLARVTPSTPRALSASEHAVLKERSRRIQAIFRQRGRPMTFEALVQATQWTRDAVLSTLVFMKERGEVLEDLDLDTGEWVYSPQDPESVPPVAPSLMLEERRALAERAETDE